MGLDAKPVPEKPNGLTVVDVATTASLTQHILERRVEYLLGSLILYTTGILERLYTSASGMC